MSSVEIKVEYQCRTANENQGFETRFMSVKLICYVKTVTVFYKPYNFFCMQDSLISWPFYNNLFQVIQHNNFWNLNRVIFTQWKHVESWVNVFRYCFKVIKQYTFHHLMNLVLIPGSQSSYEILQLFDTWRYQILVILSLSSVVALI